MNVASHPFWSLYSQGFARVAACTLVTAIADPRANGAEIVRIAGECSDQGVALAVFPELALTGYAIDDLLLQDALLDGVERAIGDLVEASRELLPVLLVGAPVRALGRVYNVALAIHRGTLLGVVPKSYLPNYREYYERRHFASGVGVVGAEIRLAGRSAPFGTDLLFASSDVPGLVVGVEICEDLWVACPPSGPAALGGALVLANPSGSPITIGKAETRRMLCLAQSQRCLAAYIYAAAGTGESTTDLAWDGQASVFEYGVALAETERFPAQAARAVTDVDLRRLANERLRQGTFDDNARAAAPAYRTVEFELGAPAGDLGLLRPVTRFPFVPDDAARLRLDCYEGYNIQVSGLAQRLAAAKIERVVIGVSGGLDSTQALLVCARAFDRLGLPRSQILAYTMPGFATGGESKGNAHALMASLAVTAAELDIRDSARGMLEQIGHPFARGEAVYDITFENVQAGLRTDYLFRLANFHNAIVVGTGDLSELALGWCTYGVGDQMSHYNVNAGVPKTLIQHLIRFVISEDVLGADVHAVLGRILASEISPELVPVAEGATPQSTEAVIGPYELLDFFLFYTLRHGFAPSRVAYLAWHAWHDRALGAWPPGFPEGLRNQYDLGTIKRWLAGFAGRFFGNSQFKRSALPNGPKMVAGGSLSPRGDWRAPSDGNARVWLEELKERVP